MRRATGSPLGRAYLYCGNEEKGISLDLFDMKVYRPFILYHTVLELCYTSSQVTIVSLIARSKVAISLGY